MHLLVHPSLQALRTKILGYRFAFLNHALLRLAGLMP
jgi:hypothetical protein